MKEYGIFVKNESTLHDIAQGWELLEVFESEYAAKEELEGYYIPENQKIDEESRCEFKIVEL